MPGVILVLIGALFLLHNYHVINFHWGNLFSLWPVFLIMGGVNLVLANNREAWATVVKIAVVVGCFCLLVFVPSKRHYYWNNSHGNFNFSDRDDDGDDDNDTTDTDTRGVIKVQGSSKFNEPFAPGVTFAKLNIQGGGSAYNLKDTTSQLFEAETKETSNRYLYVKSMEGTVPVMTLHMKNKQHNDFHFDKDQINTANIQLNTAPEWDINVKTGASELDFDLSKFKIRNLVINGGAASFDIKLGMPLANTNIETATGVSEVHIHIPKGAACQITTQSGLSSNDFEGFDKKEDNRYETAGFNTAKNKMYIRLKGGVSDFNVDRY